MVWRRRRQEEGDKKMNWEIVHVPAKSQVSLETSTVDVIASKIEPKLASNLIKQLSQVCTLENLRHVKRIQKRIVEGKVELSVLLCPSDEYENHVEGRAKDIHQLISAYKLDPYITKVAKYSATSKEEWEEQCKLWPTSYHPSTNLDGVTGLSEEESQLIFSNMKFAIQLTKSSYLGGKVSNASVIVDPSSRQIIAIAIDQTCACPTSTLKTNPNHIAVEKSEAAIISREREVSELSSKQDVLIPKFPPEESHAGVSCLNPWGWIEQRLGNQNSLVKSENRSTWHPLRHAALVAIEGAAARDRLLFPGSGSSEVKCNPMDLVLQSSDNSPAKRQKIQEGVLCKEVLNIDLPTEVTQPYLCTGFDIYLVWEPCTMCAMALVHQRIRRIFFALPNPNAGALGSIHRLQGEKSLNHHYSVFRILIPEAALHDIDLKDLDKMKHCC